MRLLALFTVFLTGFHALAQTDSAPKRAATALGALKLVPQGQAANLVSIFAREGVPAPERWYFVTFDAAEESGVREFVVAGNKLVASRGLSQFAQTLKPSDVLGKWGLRVDSDKASQIAYEYARVNNFSIGSINYELKQEGAGAPFWNLVCMDHSAQRLGEVKIAADSGKVIAHDGFALEPPPPQVKVAQPAATRSPTPRKRETPPPNNLGGKLKHFFSGH